MHIPLFSKSSIYWNFTTFRCCPSRYMKVDKAKSANKEVQSFRYYERVLPVLRQLIAAAS